MADSFDDVDLFELEYAKVIESLFTKKYIPVYKCLQCNNIVLLIRKDTYHCIHCRNISKDKIVEHVKEIEEEKSTSSIIPKN
jgi:hypothetical protein